MNRHRAVPTAMHCKRGSKPLPPLKDSVQALRRRDLGVTQMHILVAVADADLRSILDFLIAYHGNTVSTAADGEAALECWQTEQPAAVVLDAGLPKLSGLMVCRAIRNAGGISRLVLLQQTPTRADEDAARTAGADAVVAMPFSPKYLLSQIAAR